MPVALPPALQRLCEALRKLPGVGPRNAERMALALVRSPSGWPESLADSLVAARRVVRPCVSCGFFTEGDSLCAVCRDTARDPAQICVVENATDVIPIERASVYHGLYHCLGGKISPLDGVGPENLNLPRLVERVSAAPGCEVILALGTDVEGETTALYLADLLRGKSRSITRPAQGLPFGGTLEVADALTLGRALTHRTALHPEISVENGGK